VYDAEAVKPQICEKIATGQSLRSICDEEGMPDASTVTRWLADDAAFCTQYVRAREAQADFYADEIIEIADTEQDAAKARNRIEARKWKASKLQPKKYGDKIDVSHSGSIQTMPEDQLDARLADLFGKAGIVPTLGGSGPAQTDEQA
jgi:hypothetical protein